MVKEKLYDAWAKRNPKFETHFEEKLLRLFTDYGVGASDTMSSKGKILGAAYELYILAFFIGLYANKKRELTGATKTLGQPIQYWGNLDSKKLRKAYPRLREYIFIALIAKTDLDLIELEKGNVTLNQAVNQIKETMELYANYGFYFIQEKIEENPNYFYKNTGFLDIILQLTNSSPDEDTEIEEL